MLRTGLHLQVSRVRREISQACCCTAFATQRVRSMVESLRALHQSTNVQRRSALHTAPATPVARPAPVESLHLWTSGGACVRLRVCNSACDGRVAASVYIRFTCECNGIRAETIAASVSKRSVSDSQVDIPGSPVPLAIASCSRHNRSSAFLDVAKLGSSQAALHRPSAPSSERWCTNRGQTRPRSTMAAPSQAGGLPTSLAGPHCGI